MNYNEDPNINDPGVSHSLPPGVTPQSLMKVLRQSKEAQSKAGARAKGKQAKRARKKNRKRR
jgi:hypothetical protein